MSVCGGKRVCVRRNMYKGRGGEMRQQDVFAGCGCGGKSCPCAGCEEGDKMGECVG